MPVFTTPAIVNLSVNQTRGHSSHKWLLVFSTVGLCGNDPRSQIPFGWFLTVWISEPLASVDTVFWPQPAWLNLDRPMGQSQVYKNLPAPEMVTDTHREASPPRLPPHEADTVALEHSTPSKMVVVG